MLQPPEHHAHETVLERQNNELSGSPLTHYTRYIFLLGLTRANLPPHPSPPGPTGHPMQ